MNKCSMSCGSCQKDAAFVLNAGGKMMESLSLSSLSIVKHRAPKRTIYACERHESQIHQCARMYGGTVRTIAR